MQVAQFGECILRCMRKSNLKRWVHHWQVCANFFEVHVPYNDHHHHHRKVFCEFPSDQPLWQFDCEFCRAGRLEDDTSISGDLTNCCDDCEDYHNKIKGIGTTTCFGRSPVRYCHWDTGEWNSHSHCHWVSFLPSSNLLMTSLQLLSFCADALAQELEALLKALLAPLAEVSGVGFFLWKLTIVLIHRSSKCPKILFRWWHGQEQTSFFKTDSIASDWYWFG